MNPTEISGRTLAFLGDAVWSLTIREMLIEDGKTRGKTLQKDTIAYVSAKAQCHFYEVLHEEGFFTEEEEEFFHRGRNSNLGKVPGSVSPQVYRISTGFEAILGGLQLGQKWDRVRQIRDKVRTLLEE